MRILFIAPYVPSLIRVRPLQVIRELARRHEVHLVAAGSRTELGGAAELLPLCREVTLVPLQRTAIVRSCLAAALTGEPLQAAYCRSPQLDRRIAEALRARQFDVVHVEHLRAAHVAGHFPLHTPLVYDAVDCISLLLLRTLRSSHSPRQRLIAAVELHRTRRYESRLLGRYDRAAATSHEDATTLEGLRPGAKVSVVPNGVDLEYFHPLEEPHEPATIVISGKMSYHANVTAVLDFVRHVFPLVRQRQPEVRLRIVGAAPPQQLLALRRDPAITVTAYLPDIRHALGTATVAVCPVTVKVGVQNKILEAMAMGLPVVSTQAGTRGLQIEPERDALVAAGWPEFAQHICRLLENPDQRERLGAAGRQYVARNHQWSAAARHFESLYAQAIEQKAKRAQSVLASIAGST